MKKISVLLITLFSLCLCRTSVLAAPYTGSSGLTDSQCMAFSDVFKTITRSEGSYYYKYCYRAACATDNRYHLANMVYNSGYRCQNGNATPFTQTSSDGCAGYSNATCNGQPATYCTRVLFVDCTKTSSGAAYNDPYTTTTTKPVQTQAPTTTTTTRPTTTTTTKQVVNTTSRTTTTRRVTTSTKSTTTNTTTTTTTVVTEAVNKSNTNVKSIKIDNLALNVTNELNEYSVQLPYGVKSVKVKVKTEDPLAVYRVEGNTDMPDEDTQMKIIVTAQDDTTRDIIINVSRYYVASGNCYLANIHIEDYPLQFSKSNFDYKLSVDKNVKSLEIEPVVKDTDHAKFEIKGNEKLKNGSEISIIVTAEDGTECTYKINIRKGNNTWKIILILVILIGILGGAIYMLQKYLRKSKGKYKYE